MRKTGQQQLHAAVREIAAAPISGRARAFLRAGGRITPPQCESWEHLNSPWRVRLIGLNAYGDTLTEALSDWLKLARERLPHPATTRATDRRPDCPYNGQGLAS